MEGHAKRKGWTSLNFHVYAWPYILIASFSFTRVNFTCVRMEKLRDSGNPVLIDLPQLLVVPAKFNKEKMFWNLPLKMTKNLTKLSVCYNLRSKMF